MARTKKTVVKKSRTTKKKAAPKKKTTKKKAAPKKKTIKKKAASKKKTTKKATSKKKVSRKSSSLKKGYGLVVVESPAKAKTIKKYLGTGYQVVASNGHIKDLPKSKLGVELKNNSFKIDLHPITGKKDKIDRIKELAKRAGKIFLASDMDREGEAIAFHIAEEIGNKKKVHRVIFNAVTKSAIQAAMESPAELSPHLYDGQKTRRILDRLVGYKISPILWDKVQRGISAGRVQSVALKLIVEREDLIKAFVPEQWFSITGELKKNNLPFEIKYHGEEPNKKNHLTDEKFAKKILADIKGKILTVIDVKERERKQNPTPPFTTSKLQQEAAHKLGFTAKRTMMAAQKLYEGISLTEHGMQGLITYMRTDSVRTEPEFIDSVRSYIKKEYGPDYIPASPIIHKKKGTSKVQDAHEAIRPTNLRYGPNSIKGDLEPDQEKLYRLIWNKFVSSQMSQAVIDQTTLSFECQKHFFRATGSVIKFPGFRTAYHDSLGEKKSGKKGDGSEQNSGLLPKLTKGEKLSFLKGPTLSEHWTNPPPRYNEASIVKDLEEKGIGRPSTYASIISNIQDRGYVEKIENRFHPTELGSVVCRMLIESFPDIMSVDFTASIEKLIDKIEDGDIKYKKVLKDFWKDFKKSLEKAKEEMKNLKQQLTPTGIKCHKCTEGEYFIKWGRNGRFLACSAYPDCNSTYDFKQNAEGEITILPKNWFHEPCPTCGKKMEVKTGRYGRFVRCEDYPHCDTTRPYTLPIHCPECKTGKFAEKKGRYNKIFYGCTNYPECTNAIWSRPYEHDCASCGYPLMVYRETRKEGRQLQCPRCKFKVDWDETPYVKQEAESQESRA